MERLLTALFYRVRRYKIAAIALLATVLVFCAFTASKIQLEENVFDLFPKNAEIQEVSDLLGTLEFSNRLVFNVYSQDPTHSERDSLVAIADAFAHGFRDSEYVDSVAITLSDHRLEALYAYYLQQLPFYLTEADYPELEKRISAEGIDNALEKYYRTLFSPLGMVTKDALAADPLSLAAFPLQRARTFQIDENFELYQNHLITKDGSHVVFFFELHYPPNQTDKNRRLIADIDEAISKAQAKRKDFRIEYFGTAAVSVANAVQVERDIYLTVALALFIIFTFISLFYRNFITFFLVLFPALFGGLVATAVLAIYRDSVSVISLATGSVLLGITIDYSLHLLTHFKKNRDVRSLFASVAYPTLICAFTTACAFFVLLFIGSRAMQDLGIFAGVSVLAAALFSLVVLPHLTLAFRQMRPRVPTPNWVEKGVGRLAHYPFHKKVWTKILLVVFTVVALFTWRQYQFETDLLSLNFMPEKLAKSQFNLNAISSLSANTVYLATIGSSFAEALEKSARIKDDLDSLTNDGKIQGYLAATKLIPSPQLQKVRLERWEDFWRKHPQEETLERIHFKAGQLGFNEGTFTAFQSVLTKKYSTIPQKNSEELLAIFGEDLLIEQPNGDFALLTMLKTFDHQKADVLARLSTLPDTIILDRAHLVSRLAGLLVSDFHLLVNCSLLLVFLIILLSYGRIELALIAFLPILFSWLWVLGVMGLFGLSFNIVNVIICTFIFGLGIDYSIFSLRGLLENYTFGRRSFSRFKKSIILSAFTTLVGIGVLGFAQHPALRSIALLAVIGILSVLFITFTLQPMLYNFLLGRRKKNGQIPYTFFSLITSAFAFVYFLCGCAVLFLCRLALALPFGKEDHRKDLFHTILMLFCRSEIYIMANVKKQVINRKIADFAKPAVLISNHHSFIDILILLMFHPKVVLVTNDWVYRSPFFGSAVRFADFIPATHGLDAQTEKIRMLVSRGYSLAVFPEGRRQKGFDLGRFHKGAFYLSDRFGLDIQPILLHGTNLAMPKGDSFCLRSAEMTICFLPRISANDLQYGVGYSERAKNISAYFKQEYSEMRHRMETPKYFREILVKNFIYKGPVLEWYTKIKLRFEEYYAIFHEIIPRKAVISDLGCGFGLMSYALAMASAEREIHAVDYDEDKIDLARQCPVTLPQLSFAHADVAAMDFEFSDVFLISDAMHYLTKTEQDHVLYRMLEKLNANGKIIIRDGDSNKQRRHKGTKLTEYFSTNSGFNKTRNALNYISADMIAKFAEANKMEMEVIDNTQHTSNVIFVLKRQA